VRNDQVIVDYIAAHPSQRERNVVLVAQGTGLDIVKLREVVHLSKRLRMVSMGAPGWHVIEPCSE
jgi:hypothetical protein